uniref:Large ribosomal subunit protein bL36c n=2 Tax=Passiflora TaxID=3684 RepID=A0A7H0TYT5_PASVE|nr:ribosomal protein L36 [Passiflora misera]YP_009671194.1 ribosomal protein L36 [Passiflora misera]YP_010007344.1 ribosomal protein L36 [Passiflora vespertilio]YP_010007371.1 ribosomal protein L36 [Passiflora vespertilio]QCX30472.1 ribosomal protein L36 [Passiflora misera]QCX30473.1 ribosomal protein L36 [Passiflora misera]QNR06187.1 ribosomal protein L36 [Passiflora vespertilio]QNR06214.1 ribosomal protein L36 [Passiflora vespertilio]
MKKRPCARRICGRCRIVRRKGRIRVVCPNLRHKQIQG